MKERVRPLALTLGRVPAGCWVLLLTLPALVPLARPGFFQSHDGLFHVYRLAALDRAVRAGVLYPRWFPEFAFGYGHPVLNFYGPLSYYWGLPFTLLGFSPLAAMKLVLATGLIASALAMYGLARLHLDRGPAVVAAVVYAYLPYHLVDLYVRGAVAEFLAFVWFPLILWAFDRLIRPVPADTGTLPSLTSVGRASLSLAALLATHSLSALIFAPVLAAYALILWLRRPGRRPPSSFLVPLGAVALALALSAFHWLPVLAESRYVGLGYGASQGYRDHLLPLARLFSLSPTYPYPTEPGAVPTFPIGLVQLAVPVAALAVLVRPRPHRWAAAFFLGLTLLSAAMLTTASLPVWRLAEKALALLQYPWRFQALVVLGTAFLAGALVQGRGRLALGGLVVLLTAAWALWRLPVTPTAPLLSVETMWQGDREAGQVGATWTGEFLPVWVTEQRWALSFPPAEPPPDGKLLPPSRLKLTGAGYTRYDLVLDAPQGAVVALHQFHYPGWQARWGITTYPSQPAGVLGLAAFELPAGRGPLTLRLGWTAAQLGGAFLSIAAALALGAGLVTVRHPGAKEGTAWGLAAGCGLLAALLLAGAAWPNGAVRPLSPLNANLEDTVELLSFSAIPTRVRPGQTVDVTLYWRAMRPVTQDYKAFVHLTEAPPASLGPEPGIPRAQHDGDPGGGFTPTTRWLPGEVVADTHPLRLPANLPPGRYSLWAGMYEYETVRNLAVLSADVPADDGRIFLGEIEVTTP